MARIARSGVEFGLGWSMPPPIHVRLLPHDPQWAVRAKSEIDRLCSAAGRAMQTIHHIGSTSIPGIAAKPILDLLGVAESLFTLDSVQNRLEALGYASHGEYGFAGRRYYTLNDTNSGERCVQLHCYARGDPAIERHLAFRDFLCARPEVALAYEEEKARCAALHPLNSHAYTECKSSWIKRVEADALRVR